MPDGDIVHNRLAWRYQKPYKWLCEGTASISECSWAVMKALKEEIKQKGDLPIALAQQMGEKLSYIFSCHQDKSSIDWGAINMEFDRLLQQINTSHYHKELVLNAGKSLINDLRYRRIFTVENFSEMILHRYFIKVYKSVFKGIVFALLGSACAYLMGQRELCVYENGVGAINLPYRESAVGLDHSRSVHPLTLLMVSDLVSELLGETFQVRNPFLFWTKAEMCQILAEEGKNDLVALTKSCDRPHRQQPIQCGYCSSCLLRRQALAASKIEDRTRYVIFHGKRPAADPSVYLRHMLAQVHTLRCLINASDSPSLQWEALTQKFPVLDDIVDRGSTAEKLAVEDMRSCLIQLYRSYVTEWDDVESSLSVGLLNNIDQQSLDKCWSVA